MKEKRRYRGRRPRATVIEARIFLVAFITAIAMLALTMHASAQITGKSMGDQLHQALFVAEDWD